MSKPIRPPQMDHFCRYLNESKFSSILSAWKTSLESISPSETIPISAQLELEKRRERAIKNGNEKAKLSFDSGILGNESIISLIQALAKEPCISYLDLKDNEIKSGTILVILRLLQGQIRLAENLPRKKRLKLNFLSELFINRSNIEEHQSQLIDELLSKLRIENAKNYIYEIFSELNLDDEHPINLNTLEKVWNNIFDNFDEEDLEVALIEMGFVKKDDLELTYNEFESTMLRAFVNEGASLNIPPVFENEKKLLAIAIPSPRSIHSSPQSQMSTSFDSVPLRAITVSPKSSISPDNNFETNVDYVPVPPPSSTLPNPTTLATKPKPADAGNRGESRSMESPHRGNWRFRVNFAGLTDEQYDLVKSGEIEEKPQSNYITLSTNYSETDEVYIDWANQWRKSIDFSSLIDFSYSFSNIVLLVLRNNKLSSITDLQLMNHFPNLTELDLSYNNFSGAINDNDFPRRLKSLDLSYNKLSNIAGILCCSNLTSLKISNNLIKTFYGLPPKIVKLDMSYNKISSASTIRTLSICPNISYISLIGNPVTLSPSCNIRLLLRSLFRLLKEVDGIIVIPEKSTLDRQKAMAYEVKPKSSNISKKLQNELDARRSREYIIRKKNIENAKTSASQHFDNLSSSYHKKKLNPDEISKLTSRLSQPKSQTKKYDLNFTFRPEINKGKRNSFSITTSLSAPVTQRASSIEKKSYTSNATLSTKQKKESIFSFDERQINRRISFDSSEVYNDTYSYEAIDIQVNSYPERLYKTLGMILSLFNTIKDFTMKETISGYEFDEYSEAIFSIKSSLSFSSNIREEDQFSLDIISLKNNIDRSILLFDQILTILKLTLESKGNVGNAVTLLLESKLGQEVQSNLIKPNQSIEITTDLPPAPENLTPITEDKPIRKNIGVLNTPPYNPIFNAMNSTSSTVSSQLLKDFTYTVREPQAGSNAELDFLDRSLVTDNTILTPCVERNIIDDKDNVSKPLTQNSDEALNNLKSRISQKFSYPSFKKFIDPLDKNSVNATIVMQSNDIQVENEISQVESNTSTSSRVDSTYSIQSNANGPQEIFFQENIDNNEPSTVLFRQDSSNSIKSNYSTASSVHSINGLIQDLSESVNDNNIEETKPILLYQEKAKIQYKNSENDKVEKFNFILDDFSYSPEKTILSKFSVPTQDEIELSIEKSNQLNKEDTQNSLITNIEPVSTVASPSKESVISSPVSDFDDLFNFEEKIEIKKEDDKKLLNESAKLSVRELLLSKMNSINSRSNIHSSSSANPKSNISSPVSSYKSTPVSSYHPSPISSANSSPVSHRSALSNSSLSHQFNTLNDLNDKIFTDANQYIELNHLEDTNISNISNGSDELQINLNNNSELSAYDDVNEN